MSTFFHHPTAPERQENQGQSCPEGWTGPHPEEESEAEMARRVAALPPPVPLIPTYTREDYKAALDAMLQAEATRYEFDNVDATSKYLFRPASKFHLKAVWVADLSLFTWETSDTLAAQPPQGEPPTPEQFAALILSMFEADNPRPS